MEFDLKQTSELLIALPNADEAIAIKTREVVEEVLAIPAVSGAAHKRDLATENVLGLKVAVRTLNAYADKLDGFLSSAERLAPWVDHARRGEIPSAEELDKVSRANAELTMATRSIQHITEVLLPLGNIAQLRADADYHREFSDALGVAAHNRATKLVETLASATDTEGALAVDPHRGVSGLLVRLSSEASKDAWAASAQADELEARYRGITKGA